eukprot:4399533-Karenia_brevis.AAC.1
MPMNFWVLWTHQQRQLVIGILDYLECYRYCEDFWTGQLPQEQQIPSLDASRLNYFLVQLKAIGGSLTLPFLADLHTCHDVFLSSWPMFTAQDFDATDVDVATLLERINSRFDNDITFNAAITGSTNLGTSCSSEVASDYDCPQPSNRHSEDAVIIRTARYAYKHGNPSQPQPTPAQSANVGRLGSTSTSHP